MDNVLIHQETNYEACAQAFIQYPEETQKQYLALGVVDGPDGPYVKYTEAVQIACNHSCRSCEAGKHTYGTGQGAVCDECGMDVGKSIEIPFTCAGGHCATGHRNSPGSFCAACLNDAQAEALGMEKIGFFAQGGSCVICGDTIATMILGLTVSIVGSTGLTYMIVKGLSADDIERVKGGMDFTKAMSAVFGMLQRLTAIMTLPFGWPGWLIALCHSLKGVVQFDFPGLAAPECQAAMSPAELFATRLSVGAIAMPLVWFVILLEMTFIAHCTKMGKRKRRRGMNLFGISLFNKCFPKLDCGAGAFEMMMITMHQLFFLSVVSQGFAAINCVEMAGPPDEATGEQTTFMALSSNPAVRCSFCSESCCDSDFFPGPKCYEEEEDLNAPGTFKPNETDPGIYTGIFIIAWFMILIYGFVMVFFHWSVRVEFVGCINKAIVAAVVIFLGRSSQALIALPLLMITSTVFGFLARRWYIEMEEDDDDTNDTQGDAFYCLYIGSLCENLTYGLGMIMVIGTRFVDTAECYTAGKLFSSECSATCPRALTTTIAL